MRACPVSYLPPHIEQAIVDVTDRRRFNVSYNLSQFQDRTSTYPYVAYTRSTSIMETIDAAACLDS